MDKKHSAAGAYRWKEEVIAAGLLMAFAFFINRDIEIKGLFMDDLYLWSFYGEQSFREFVLPIGGTRFRFLYYILAYIEFMIVGRHITWFVPCNILLNGLIGYTVFCFGRHLSKNRVIGFFCGFLYLLSRMSYYQISQVCGLMESVALWMAIGILFCLFCFINESDAGRRQSCFWGAGALYLCVCFVHERYMALVVVLLAALVMRRERRLRNWLLVPALFLAVQLIRLAVIGTLSPAGTGGTNVADTWNTGQALTFAIRQVLYLFGVNHDESYLNALSWAETARWVKALIVLADIAIALIVLAFIVKLVRDRRQRRLHIQNMLLFVLFIGACIACSSVTIRVEVRWVYVSMTAAWLLLAYMCGAAARPAAKEGEALTARRLPDYGHMLACIGMFFVYTLLMLPVETYYRGCYPNLYFWHGQQEYNSLAEETYEKYGDGIFGKKIYILNNYYGVSEFNAETFFKTFDKEKEAEGTQVIFVDTIRDFGQVTDNMLVLREEPQFYKYQDITDVVRNLKCESVYGYYRDGWMDESARVRVMTGSTGVIWLRLLYPGEMTGKEIVTIFQDGRLKQEVLIEENITSVELKAEPYDIVELDFENNFYLEGAKEQRGEKRFSLLVEITAD